LCTLGFVNSEMFQMFYIFAVSALYQTNGAECKNFAPIHPKLPYQLHIQ
jgi:hypothetical protein